MSKLTIHTDEPWRVYIEVDGHALCVPLNADNESYTIDIDGTIHVASPERLLVDESGADSIALWDAMIDTARATLDL